MKRQNAEIGVKYWDNADMISLQAEPLKAIEGLFAEYEPCIVSGCNITSNGSTFDVSAGLVALKGRNNKNEDVMMVVPFRGATGTALPLYLTLAYDVETREYGDAKVKPIAYDYYASASTIAPAAGTQYFTLLQSGTPRFVDVLQDVKHLFTTDTQQAQWTAKETPAGAQAKADAAKTAAITAAATDASTKADAAKADAISTSKAYTDTREAAIQSVVDNKDTATLRSAKTYTDTRETILRNDVAIANTATLRDAKSYADMIVAALVDNSPETLNTLNELAAALGNDPNFAATVMQLIGERVTITDFNAALAGKFDKSGGTITGGYASRIGAMTIGCGNDYWGSKNYIEYSYEGNTENTVIRVVGGSENLPKLRLIANGEMMWNDKTVYHSGNFDPDSKLACMYFNGNLNDISESGLYRFQYGCTNIPNSSSLGCHLFHSQWDNNAARQVYYSYPVNDTFTRFKYSGEWSAWVKYFDESNLKPFQSDAGYITTTQAKSLTTSGAYSNTDAPGFTGIILHFQASGSMAAMQIITPGYGSMDTQIRFQRDGGSDNWSPMYRLFHAGNFDPASKADANHNHNGVYQPAGNYQQAGDYAPNTLATSTVNGLMSAADKRKLDQNTAVTAAVGSVTIGGTLNGYGLAGVDAEKIATGKYRINHYGKLDGIIMATARPENDAPDRICTVRNQLGQSFEIHIGNGSNSYADCAFSFVVYKSA